MCHAIDRSGDWTLKAWCGPLPEDFGDLAHALALKTRKQAPLKIIHGRSGIGLRDSVADPKCDFRQARLVAGVVECKRVSVIDDVEGVAGFGCRRFQQGNGGIFPLIALDASYTPAFGAKRGFEVALQYDVHRFITPALRTTGFPNPRPVHRLALSVSARLVGQ